MKISKQLGWMIGLGLLSFTLVGVGTTSKPPEAQAAAAESAPVCRPAAPASEASPTASVVPQGIGTGGAAGSGPPLNGGTATHEFQMAAATARAPSTKAPTTDLVFFPLWARQ